MVVSIVFVRGYKLGENNLRTATTGGLNTGLTSFRWIKSDLTTFLCKTSFVKSELQICPEWQYILWKSCEIKGGGGGILLGEKKRLTNQEV